MYKELTIDVMTAAVLLDNLERAYGLAKDGTVGGVGAQWLIEAYERLEKAFKEAK